MAEIIVTLKDLKSVGVAVPIICTCNSLVFLLQNSEFLTNPVRVAAQIARVLHQGHTVTEYIHSSKRSSWHTNGPK